MTEKYIIKLTSFATLQTAKSIINNSRSDWFSKANTLVWAEPCARWEELKMLSFWAGGISSFPPCAREYRLLRRLVNLASQLHFLANKNAELAIPPLFWPVNCIKIGGHVALLSDPTVYSLYCDVMLLKSKDFRDLNQPGQPG